MEHWVAVGQKLTAEKHLADDVKKVCGCVQGRETYRLWFLSSIYLQVLVRYGSSRVLFLRRLGRAIKSTARGYGGIYRWSEENRTCPIAGGFSGRFQKVTRQKKYAKGVLSCGWMRILTSHLSSRLEQLAQRCGSYDIAVFVTPTRAACCCDGHSDPGGARLWP